LFRLSNMTAYDKRDSVEGIRKGTIYEDLCRLVYNHINKSYHN
jgi:hypothetical protein